MELYVWIPMMDSWTHGGRSSMLSLMKKSLIISRSF